MKQCIGVDLGTKKSVMVVLNEEAEVAFTTALPTSQKSVRAAFLGLEPSWICLEVGTVSPWVTRILEELGHEVVAVNPRRLRVIAESTLKTDELDAETLARLGRLAQMDPKLLSRVQHRSEATQLVRSRLAVRRSLIECRTKVISTARGLTRSLGHALPQCRTSHFPGRVRATSLPDAVHEVLAPLVAACEHLNEQVAGLDEHVEKIAEKHPAVARLTTIPGIGALTALSYVLCIEDPSRFAKSRAVGPYLGLRPRIRESGESRWSGGITRQGDQEMRLLLVQAAHRLIQHRGESELQNWARRLLKTKKRQVVVIALARRLAVLMHRMWTADEQYRPFPSRDAAAAA